MEERKNRQVNPVLMVGAIIVVIMVVLIVVSIVGLFHTNPYGASIKIDNFSHYFGNVSQDKREQIEHELYELVAWNGLETGDIPEAGAMVRDGTATYEYEEDDELYRGGFIVDIAEIQESYKVSFISPSDKSPAKDVSYQTIITCVPGTMQIYDFYNCRDMYTDTVSWGNEYQLDYTIGTNASYRVRMILNEAILGISSEGHVALVDETSMRTLSSVPDNQYSFEVDINGDHKMSVIARMDELFGKEYIALLVDLDGDKSGYLWNLRSDLETELSNWIVNQSGLDEIEITHIPAEDS